MSDFGSRVTRGGRNPRRPQPGDLTIPWSAKLIQPHEMRSTSMQEVVVEVSAPRPLTGEAHLRLTPAGGSGDRTLDAGLTWHGDAGQTRRAYGWITRPPAGVYDVDFVQGATVVATTPRRISIRAGHEELLANLVNDDTTDAAEGDATA